MPPPRPEAEDRSAAHPESLLARVGNGGACRARQIGAFGAQRRADERADFEREFSRRSASIGCARPRATESGSIRPRRRRVIFFADHR